MSTVSIVVEHANQAFMLADWLKNIRFVREVNIYHDEQSCGNVNEVQRVLDTMNKEPIFVEITDPVAYQKTLRNEWN